ncbi:50S ribosomal protein L31e [Candidatus Altiarchaeota archaeon]
MAEKIYNIPLRGVYKSPETKRANSAVRLVKEFLQKQNRTENIVIDNSLNQALWKRGISKPPRKIKVKVSEEEEGRLVASLAE